MANKNTYVWEVLRKIPPASITRILDIGGARFGGDESIAIMQELFPEAAIDVQASKRQLIEDLGRKFGCQFGFVGASGPDFIHKYDLMCLMPPQARIVESWLAFPQSYGNNLRVGGVVFGLGILPNALAGKSDFLPLEPQLRQKFIDTFCPGDEEKLRLPQELSDFRLLGCVPWRKTGRSYLSLMVLQKLRDSSADGARGSKLGDPDERSRLPWRTAMVGTGKLTQEQLEDFPFFAAREFSPALADIELPEPPAEYLAQLRKSNFDSAMFVVNGFANDPRVAKTAAAVRSFGRTCLAIGIRDNAAPYEYLLDTLPCGTQRLLLPNPGRNITIALKARKAPLNRAPRHELWLAAIAVFLGRLLHNLVRTERFILHTHDYHGLYVGGLARAAVMDSGFRWFHDIHEFIREYDIIDPGLQAAGTAWEERFIHDADFISTIGEVLAERLVKQYALGRTPAAIYNSNLYSARYKYRGQTSRQKLGLGNEPLLVHSGTITKGRGVEHIIRALPLLQNAQLLLITESTNPFFNEVMALAEELDVKSRVHLHPYLPHDEVVGFIADADIGLIAPDIYGNASVGMPNKLFDYIFAGIPIVSSNTEAMLKFLEQWPVGEAFEASDAKSLAAACKTVLDNSTQYKLNIAKRMDLMLGASWEAQISKIQAGYNLLSK